MALTIKKHTETFSSSPQIHPEDVPEIAKLGFKSIINARPDFEGGNDQPTSESIKAAAEKAGLHYAYIPVTPNNIGTSDIETCASFIDGAPSPILGFCKTGMRATSLYQSGRETNDPTASMGKQNWLMGKVDYFFKNKCLVTKLYRKLNKTNA